VFIAYGGSWEKKTLFLVKRSLGNLIFGKLGRVWAALARGDGEVGPELLGRLFRSAEGLMGGKEVLRVSKKSIA